MINKMLTNLIGLALLISLILNLKVISSSDEKIEETKSEIRHLGSKHPQEHNDVRHQQDEKKSSKEMLLLESIEDLEQISYMSMRNFNITDETLLQSNWLGGLSEPLGGRNKYQKIGSGTDAVQNRLALMLESFIWHLRNGHLRRLKVEDLYAMLIGFGGASDHITPPSEQPQIEASPNSNLTNSTQTIVDEASERCRYLVAIYKLERQHRQQQHQQEQQSNEYSITEDEEDQQVGSDISDSRLTQLCKLAVSCHSADELASLIGSPTTSDWSQSRGAKRRQIRSEKVFTGLEPEPAEANAHLLDEDANYPRIRSLRDSLSGSLVKLCPLILFQLHDDEGVCSVRRDDRPPTVTVWAFATLFVTIVSFCSLIGLSITPLLGGSGSGGSGGKYVPEKSPTRNDHSDSNLSGHAERYGEAVDEDEQSSWVERSGGHVHQHHRACLTLFEGLAVGSLAGSALFSLIPQAFELQERESNQGFLLKALIIFFGIYLFFCSERVMRIILDSRQQRKRRKRLNHRSSNSMPIMAAATSTVAAVASSKQSAIELSSWVDKGEKHQQLLMNRRAARRAGRIDQRLMMRVSPETATTGAGVAISEQDRQQTDAQLVTRSALASQRLGQQAWSQPIKGQELGEQTCTELSGRRNPVAKVTSGKVPFNATDCKHNKMPACDATATSSGNGLLSCDSRHKSSKSAKARSDCFVCNQKTREQQQYLLAAAARRRQRHTRKTRQQLSTNRRHQQLRRRLRRQSSSAGASAGSSSSTNSSSCSSSSTSSSSSSFWTLEMQNLSNCYRNNYYYSDQHHSLNSRSALKKQQLNSPTSRLESRSYSVSPREGTEQHHQFNKISSLSSHRRMQRAKVDISTVAWMIILGDGLHNFIDGISIGAAFAESILSGVSISVAVICEEFPHELGDFAVLVSSGMTVRQALGYNFLSACTCYLGMVVGIVLGDVNEGASYISALAAGVFLYIALVDMMGELSATLEETSRDSITRTLKLFLLQNVGIFIGISIIFVLSFIDF